MIPWPEFDPAAGATWQPAYLLLSALSAIHLAVSDLEPGRVTGLEPIGLQVRGLGDGVGVCGRVT